MHPSERHDDHDVDDQRRFWNTWNAATRELVVDDVAARQGEIVSLWLAEQGRHDLEIIEVGCGAGWLSPQLLRFGRVTATDLADALIERARRRTPEVQFVAGDFRELEFGDERFDVVVSLEVLAHVEDQPAFVTKLRRLLKPGGHLLLSTQNRPVLERFNRIPPPGPGQLRRWVDQAELRDLLTPQFDVLRLTSVTPRADRGVMRVMASRKLQRAVRPLVGDRLERSLEHLGLGWTLMAIARRPSE